MNYITLLVFLMQPPASSPMVASQPAPRSVEARLRLEAAEDQESAISEEAARLMKAATNAAEDQSRAARIAAARFLVCHAAEPALSRLLLDIGTPTDEEHLQKVAAEAIALLGQGVSQASSAPARDVSACDDPEVLSALAAAMRVIARCGTNPPAGAERAAFSTALSGLAKFTDDPRPQLAIVSRTLQAAGYRRLGRADRALDVLQRNAFRASVDAGELYMSVQEIRATAEREFDSAAVALAIRIEARFAAQLSAKRQSPAVNVLRVTRWRLQNAWAVKLEASGDKSGAAEARAAMDRLAQSLGDGEISMMRLGSVLPVSPGN